MFEQTPADITVEPVTWNGYNLTAFRANPALSRETNAYSATLRKDGRKIGVLSNNGNGGASRIDAGPSASRALEQEIVDTPSGIRLSGPDRAAPEIGPGQTLIVILFISFILFHRL